MNSHANGDPVDVVVVGAGAAGGVVARRLAEAGIGVLCLGQGEWHDRAYYRGAELDWELTARKQWSGSPNIRGLPDDYPVDDADSDISPLMFAGVGYMIELQSGRTWEQFVRERILQPLDMTSTEVGLIASIYLIGEVVGALVFGRLSDQLGRKRLLIVTLLLYLCGTGLAAFTVNDGGWLWLAWFYGTRLIAGAGIGGQYAAINSAIDEMMPSKYRGRVDVWINGTYWAGAIVGSMLGSSSIMPPRTRRQRCGLPLLRRCARRSPSACRPPRGRPSRHPSAPRVHRGTSRRCGRRAP